MKGREGKRGLFFIRARASTHLVLRAVTPGNLEAFSKPENVVMGSFSKCLVQYTPLVFSIGGRVPVEIQSTNLCLVEAISSNNTVHQFVTQPYLLSQDITFEESSTIFNVRENTLNGFKTCFPSIYRNNLTLVGLGGGRSAPP